MILREPVVHSVPPGTFYDWLKMKGKLGGQNEMPPLYNERRHVEGVLSVASQINK